VYCDILRMSIISEFPRVHIRPFASSDSLEELTSLLNKSYRKLADQGFRFLATHQNAETTKERIENAECYVALMDKNIIGTICYYAPKVKDGNEYYSREGVASFGQFAVDPHYQKLGLGSKLVDHVERCAIRDKAKEIAIDTAEGANELIRFYKNRGYEFIMYVQWDVTNYRSVIMTKKLE
jgi:GNAT superfamily N-acetyltransferase